MVLTLIIIIIVVLMADSIITAAVIVALLLNFLAISAYWKELRHGYASMNIAGWGAVPKDETAEEETADEETKDEESNPVPIKPRKSLIEENIIPAENTSEDQNTNLYGRAQEEYDGYINAYTNCWRKPKPVIFQSCAEQDYSIDAANVMMAQRRARDKRCIDGAVSKDAGFFKHHYAEELDESENKIWWSRSEY